MTNATPMDGRRGNLDRLPSANDTRRVIHVIAYRATAERCALCSACVVGGICDNGHTPRAAGSVWS